MLNSKFSLNFLPGEKLWNNYYYECSYRQISKVRVNIVMHTKLSSLFTPGEKVFQMVSLHTIGISSNFINTWLNFLMFNFFSSFEKLLRLCRRGDWRIWRQKNIEKLVEFNRLIRKYRNLLLKKYSPPNLNKNAFLWVCLVLIFLAPLTLLFH